MDHEIRKLPGITMLVYPSIVNCLLDIRVWNQNQCGRSYVSMLHKKKTTCSNGWEEEDIEEEAKEGFLLYLKAGWG